MRALQTAIIASVFTSAADGAYAPCILAFPTEAAAQARSPQDIVVHSENKSGGVSMEDPATSSVPW